MRRAHSASPSVRVAHKHHALEAQRAKRKGTTSPPRAYTDYLKIHHMKSIAHSGIPMQYDTVCFGMVRYRMVQFGIMQYKILWYSIKQYNLTQQSIMNYNTV